MALLLTEPHQNYNKLQNYHSELSEIELSGSLTTTELKKPHPSRCKDAETWKGLVLLTHVW